LSAERVEVTEQERCTACGSRLSVNAAWCGQCFAPVEAAPMHVRRPAHPAGTVPAAGRTHTRWRGTTTTFGPLVKLPVTVLVLLAALWGPVTGLVAAPAAPAPSAPSPATSQVTTAIGAGLLPTGQSTAVVTKVSAAVGSGMHSVSLASAFMSWAVHLLLAGAFLYFLWKPGYRIGGPHIGGPKAS